MVPVVATLVAQTEVPIYLEGLGSATAFKTITLRSQVDGRLDSVSFNEGSPVHTGQQLAQIDPRPFKIQLQQAEGALGRDTAQLEAAKKNLERYRSMSSQKLIAQQQADDQAALVSQLEGSVRVDQAAVESAKLNLSYAHITSPIDGVTGVRLVDPGNLVRASDPTGLVVLTQLDPISVIFTLPQDALPEVMLGMAGAQLSVEAWSRDGVLKLGTGKLLLIDNQINQATATLRLKAVFPNQLRLLWPNQFVKAKLLVSVRKGALVVPSTVVQRGPEGTFAYVVQADQTVKPRPLQVERTIADQTLIAKGLQAGDLVVVDGQNQLRAGAKVQVRMLGAPAAGDMPAGRPVGVERGSKRGEGSGARP